jgi:hypothetical protein
VEPLSWQTWCWGFAKTAAAMAGELGFLGEHPVVMAGDSDVLGENEGRRGRELR